MSMIIFQNLRVQSQIIRAIFVSSGWHTFVKRNLEFISFGLPRPRPSLPLPTSAINICSHLEVAKESCLAELGLSYRSKVAEQICIRRANALLVSLSRPP